MATVVDSIVQPDENAIKSHLDLIFAPLREEYPGGLIELRYGAAFASAYFNLRDDGCADAAAFAASRSRAGDNVYVGVNPRKPSTDLRRAASDTDVEIAIWQFADIDKAEALHGLGKKLRPLPVFYSVDTGTVPHRRPHLYWLLDEPVWNMGPWTERQRGIAQSLGGDSVINPSRIMRLAGTINFPTQDKLKRGYTVERVTLKTEFEDEREATTPDEIAQAFPVKEIGLNAAENRQFSPVSGQMEITPGQSTLSAMRPTRIHDLIEACRSGDQWHNNMIRLVAHLAALGRTSAEILAMADHITLPGFTVQQTWREMETALRGARSKWALPEPADDPVEAEEAVREEADSIFPLLDLDELEALPPPEWLIHELIVQDGLTVIYGDPGAGKSFVALDMALRLSMGMDWHGTATKPTGVLYIAGEGARGLGKRVKGWRREHALEGADAPFLLLPVPVAMLQPEQRAKLLRTIDAAAARAGFAIGLVVIDTVSRALAGAGENGADEMGAFVAVCDAVRLHIGGAVLGVHHSGKDKDRGMRGSTVLLGACDGTIRIEKDEQTVTLKTEKQKDAEEAAPIYMTMKKVSWATGLEEEQSTLVPFRSEAPVNQAKSQISRETIYEALKIIDAEWQAGSPLSPYPQAKRTGSFAPAVIANRLGIATRLVAEHLEDWQMNGVLSFEQIDSHSKAKGLRVVEWIMP